jgi:hypothetical protein
VKPAEAQALFAELRSAYPSANVDADTLRIYQRELAPMRYELAKEAVVSAIGSCRFLPTIAELHHYYGIAREQRRREVDAENRRLERIAEDNFERPSLKEIPAAQELLARYRGVDVEQLLRLEEVSEGRCDDCHREGPRFAFEKLGLCSRCVTNRLRVKAQVEAA